MRSREAIILAAVVAAAGTVAGCASSPVPNEKIAVAQAQITRAEQAGAAQSAPVPLASARQKLLEAQRAAAKSDGVMAGNMADQSNVDAQLAEATAMAAKSHQTAGEFDQSMKALQQEANRPTQSAQ